MYAPGMAPDGRAGPDIVDVPRAPSIKIETQQELPTSHDAESPCLRKEDCERVRAAASAAAAIRNASRHPFLHFKQYKAKTPGAHRPSGGFLYWPSG